MANATIPARFPAFLAGTIDFHGAFLPLLTSMFLHAGLAHLAGNMLFLWIFGDNVEDFLDTYLTCCFIWPAAWARDCFMFYLTGIHRCRRWAPAARSPE